MQYFGWLHINYWANETRNISLSATVIKSEWSDGRLASSWENIPLQNLPYIQAPSQDTYHFIILNCWQVWEYLVPKILRDDDDNNLLISSSSSISSSSRSSTSSSCIINVTVSITVTVVTSCTVVLVVVVVVELHYYYY